MLMFCYKLELVYS